MAITTTSLLPPAVAQSYSQKMLSVKTPNNIHNIAAVPKMMPRNGGTDLRMRRPNPLLTSLVPLGNSGEPVPAQLLTAVDIDAKISFYGSFVILNEQVVLQNQDPKMYGVFKSLLIDLEALVNLFMGDRAEGFCF